MPTPETVFIAETLAATAFYYGLAGGVAGYVFVLSVRVLIGKIRGLFVWR